MFRLQRRRLFIQHSGISKVQVIQAWLLDAVHWVKYSESQERSFMIQHPTDSNRPSTQQSELIKFRTIQSLRWTIRIFSPAQYSVYPLRKLVCGVKQSFRTQINNCKCCYQVIMSLTLVFFQSNELHNLFV